MNSSDRPKAAPTYGHIKTETKGPVIVASIDGGPDAVFDAEIARQFKELVDRADRDPNVRAVVFTGTHPERFLSHADVQVAPIWRRRISADQHAYRWHRHADGKTNQQDPRCSELLWG